jgi:rhamnopyranosyl-N-acetylglucosaminyl-diphospho-decaprenol beta-1,3/1,4-galactofuranosyltransferase
MKLSVASVTLAYNSVHLLPEQLDRLLRQSRSLDEIVVVNNASTDGTLDLLRRDFPQVTVVNLPSNGGAGGGYAAGLAYAAIEKKHDWVWLLDHDSLPRNDALQMLLAAPQLTDENADEIGMLASCPTNSKSDVAYHGVLWGTTWETPSPEVSRQPVYFVDVVISSGSLVRREVVEEIGLPRADFFIDFVDFEYCLRARRHGYKIGMVRDSHLAHAIGTPRTVEIFGFSKSWTQQPAWREYYLSRNYTYTIWNFYADWKSKLFTIKWLLRHAAAIAAFGKNKRECIRMMLSGFADGRAGKLGIRHLNDAPKAAIWVSFDKQSISGQGSAAAACGSRTGLP